MAIAKILPSVVIVLLAGTCYCDRCGIGDNKFVKQCITRDLMVTYDDIMHVLQEKQPNVLLIDVRPEQDLKSTGSMPGSINMPFEIVKELLQLDSKKFETKFGVKKPSPDTQLIFYSRTGVRAGEAADVAHKLGFKNVKSYVGSWDQFAKIRGLRTE